MKAVWQNFRELHFLLKIIWIFCVVCLLLDTWAIGNDLGSRGVLLQLHFGFWMLYLGQVVFILFHERIVWILSFLQLILAFLTNLDFTFVPPLRLVGEVVYMIWGPFSVDGTNIYKYVFVSLCFSLELLKTFLLWWLLCPDKTEKTTAESAQ